MYSHLVSVLNLAGLQRHRGGAEGRKLSPQLQWMGQTWTTPLPMLNASQGRVKMSPPKVLQYNRSYIIKALWEIRKDGCLVCI